MLRIERTDDVLDLGCGTGHLAQEIRVLTDGRVVGIDPSPEMIALARQAAPEGIELVTGLAEDLEMPGEFDAVFCNSAFRWFTDAPRALANCFAALRPGGRMVMQARELILADFAAQADARGLLEVVFSRVYVLARKPWPPGHGDVEADVHAR